MSTMGGGWRGAGWLWRRAPPRGSSSAGAAGSPGQSALDGDAVRHPPDLRRAGEKSGAKAKAAGGFFVSFL